jgi:HEAT repeat protein
MGLLLSPGAARAGEHLALEDECLELLAKGNADQRRHAAVALGALGSARAIEPLVKILVDETCSVQRATGTIGEIQMRLLTPLGRLHYAARALFQIGPPAVPALLEAYRRILAQDQDAVAQHLLVVLDRLAPSVPEALVRAARDENPAIRLFVLSALVRAQPTDMVVSALLHLLEDAVPFVREQTLLALEQVGPDAGRAMAPLLALVSRGNEHEAWLAAQAIEAVGPPEEAASRLLQIGDDPAVSYAVRAACIAAVGKTGGAAIEPLCERVVSGDMAARAGAIRGLLHSCRSARSECQSQIVVQAVRAALRSRDARIEEAAMELSELLGRSAEALLPELTDLLLARVEFFGFSGAAHLRAALQAIENVGSREEFSARLNELASVATRPLRERIAAIRLMREMDGMAEATAYALLAAEGCDLRLAALEALSSRHEAACREAVRGYLFRKDLEDREEDYLEALVGALRGRSPKIDELIAEACAAGDAGIREAALKLLIRLGPPFCQVTEILPLLEDEEPHIPFLAALALGRCGTRSSEVLEALRGVISKDSDLDVVEEALRALGSLGRHGTGAAELLRWVEESDSDRVAAAAVTAYAASAIDPDSIVQQVMEWLTHEAPAIREAAARAAGSIPAAAPHAVPILIGMLADSHEEVRRSAALSLGELKDSSPAVVEALARLLEEKRKQVRLCGIEALGMLGAAACSVAPKLARMLDECPLFDSYDHAVTYGLAKSLGSMGAGAVVAVPALDAVRMDIEILPPPLGDSPIGFIGGPAPFAGAAPRLPESRTREEARSAVLQALDLLGNDPKGN